MYKNTAESTQWIDKQILLTITKLLKSFYTVRLLLPISTLDAEKPEMVRWSFLVEFIHFWRYWWILSIFMKYATNAFSNFHFHFHLRTILYHKGPNFFRQYRKLRLFAFSCLNSTCFFFLFFCIKLIAIFYSIDVG